MMRFSAFLALAVLLPAALPTPSPAQLRSGAEEPSSSSFHAASAASYKSLTERSQDPLARSSPHTSPSTLHAVPVEGELVRPARVRDRSHLLSSAADSSAAIRSLASRRVRAERAHLWRIAAWGGLNAAGGLALVLGAGRDQRPGWWGFGAQSGLWGVVNIGIATAGLLSSGEPNASYDAALSAERTYHDILLFNLGLNVAYSAVGTTLVAVSYRGVKSARSLRGHGSSLILQGAGLIVFDAIAFLGSRTRLAGLIDMAGSLSARALPTGVSLTWHIGP